MKVVKQRDLKDCGVCALQSIILHYNGYVSLEKLRLDTYTNKDGTNAYNLIKAAKSYGFDAYGIKANASQLFKEPLVFPTIAHLRLKNGLEHFVVIYKVSKNKLQIMDPAKGKIVMNKKDFLEVWTNVLIIIHPQQKIIKYERERRLLDLFFEIVNSQSKIIFQLILTSILLTIVSLLSNYYFKIGLNAITNNLYINSLKLIILIFACVTLFKIMFQYLRTYFENHLNKNIDINLFSNFIKHLFNLPLNIVQSRSLGEIVTRVHELNDLKIMFTDFFVTIFLDSILTMSSMIFLIFISKELFFVLCIALMLYLLIGLVFNKINYKKIMQNIEFETEFNTTLIENLNMFSSIKNLNTTDLNLNWIEKKLIKYLKDNYILTNFFNKQNLSKNMINELTLFIVNTFGFYLIYINSLEILDLITFNSLMSYYIDPIKNMIDMLPKINYLKASFYKLNDFLANKVEFFSNSKEEIIANNIEFKNVDYSYNGYDLTLKNFSLSIKANEHVFLKGASGAGKSTICKLLYKLVTVNKGNILIGGVSISDYSLDAIRNNICYVSQTENLYTGTIKENILYHRDIDLSDFNKICNICKLEDLVTKRPLRYETVISDDTNYLSGGEKQRIILARALLKNSQILVLDEALSEVDFKTESEIIKNILNTFQNKTIIYISHKEQSGLFDRTIFLKDLNEQ